MEGKISCWKIYHLCKTYCRGK